MMSIPLWDSLIYTVPFLVAYTIGLVYVAGKRRYAPRACTVAMAAFAILLATDVMALALRIYVFSEINANMSTAGNRLGLLRLTSLPVTAIHAIGWVALAVAVGLDRVPRRSPIVTSGPEY